MKACFAQNTQQFVSKETLKSDEGFSLVEALVAMVVFSLAAMALLSVQSESSRALVALEDKLFAEIVAENILVERMSGSTRAESNRQSGIVEMGSRKWQWAVVKSSVVDNELTNIEITISNAADGQIVYSLNTFEVAGN